MNYHFFQLTAFPAMRSLCFFIRAKMAGGSCIYHFPGLRSFLTYPGLLKSDPYRVYVISSLFLFKKWVNSRNERDCCVSVEESPLSVVNRSDAG